ncbi:MAG: tetraacyldisaccharide 4'-kinase [Nitrospirae bacterium]|nr:tetraacyldisaccharide 4'-kinase [Nitrospirota bacterium]
MSFLYGIILRIRSLFYSTGIIKKRQLSARVISIGNITAGGTGKTPMVIAIAEVLAKNRKKAAVLSRGYRSKEEGNLRIVSDGKEIKLDPESAGDEPYLIAERLKNVPVLICPDRYKSGRHAVESLGADTIILDDGFQNLGLKKDVNILLIDAMNPFGNNHLLPRGVLREPLSAVKRADAVVITRADFCENINGIIKQIKAYNDHASIFKAIYRPSGLKNIIKGKLVNADELKNKTVTIFSGIANPLSFHYLIKKTGARIANEFIFNDHHAYTKEDIDKINPPFSGARSRGIKGDKGRASDKKADLIITTEKDAVKIRGLIAEDLNIWALRADMVILEDNKEWERVVLD